MSDDKLYLLHIADCIAKVEQYSRGGRREFEASTLVQDAVVRNLQVLAESTQRISDGLKAGHPEIDWRAIAGFRNVLVHGYIGLDVDKVWSVVANDLPALRIAVKAILDAM